MKRLLTWLLTRLFGGIVIPKRKLKFEIEKKMPQYERELESLVKFLTPEVGEKPCVEIEDEGHTARVFVSSGDTIAKIKPFPKGDTKKQTYIKVELFDGSEGLGVWFLLAFLGFRVTLTRPVMQLLPEQAEKPRGQ